MKVTALPPAATVGCKPMNEPSDDDIDIGVIYSGEDTLMQQLLPSLARSVGNLKARLVLVDNASRNGTALWNSYFDSTLSLRNDTRLGYAANLNRILKASGARYTLLLNTDMYFDPEEECIAKMVEFMDHNPECGISGCRLYHGDGSYAFPARRFQSLRIVAARRLGLGRFMSQEILRYLYQDRADDSVFDCEWLSGCFLLVRRSAMKTVGYLDTGFPKYFEDVDICLRMALTGWRVMLNGRTYCYHLERRASKRLFSRDAWLHLRSYVHWIQKWGFHPSARIAQSTRQPSQLQPAPGTRLRKAA